MSPGFKRVATAALLLSFASFAGQGWAGEAWRAEYAIRDHAGAHTLVVVGDDTRVEYRTDGASTLRIWRRIDDGIERIEAFPEQRRAVVYSPGDLRTIAAVPDWNTLRGVLPPALRDALRRVGSVTRHDASATRYRGTTPEGRAALLEWLEIAGLPARYRVGSGRDGYSMQLTSLQRMPAAEAFTDLTDFRAYDHADLGDMGLDPFAREYLGRQGRHHAH